MRVVLQRVRSAAVSVDGAVTGRIDHGLMALVGVGQRSTAADAEWLAAKTQDLRVFADDAGRMNRSVRDVGGGVLAISQFTLYGDARKGRRPSFVAAAAPDRGEALYEAYCDALEVPVGRGVFGADMAIDMVCDGPVTILLDHGED
ncbi:D-aminoacyl-tRNA deacylase [Euzebya pacifica]|jgi:D-tyrosyl-tRNA(Tyr) deacylase|uniref:D-aminoacyl-tRNA deacylase n=1 Tax=Euzebya pacifica TaxID=1608957 RepID=UPI0030FAC013